MCRKGMTAPLPRWQAGGLPGCISGAQRRLRKDVGRDRKEGKATKDRKDRKYRSGDSRWAWSPLSRAGPPSACRSISFHSPVPSVLSSCNSGSSRKWLNPMYFPHSTPWCGWVRSSLLICMGGRWGGWYMWGNGLKQRKWPLSHVSELEQHVPITGRGYQAQCLLRCEGIGKHY